MNAARAIDQVILQHLPDLKKRGVLSVRPGYEASGGWVTNKPAIVVTVERKRDDVPAQDRLPETLGGYPVDVRQASPLHKLRVANPALHAQVLAGARPQYARPSFPFERDFTGQPFQPHEALAAAAHAPSKPQLPYQPPAQAPLQAVQGNITITCHASPDAGWPTLKAFLSATTAMLTTGMYDFTAAHILATVRTVLKTKKLRLVLDHPKPDPHSDQTDDQTVAALQDDLGQSLQFAWALERMDPHAAAWIYPNAYHIKVAVRDSTAFWLSSGNWNNSNQPDIDPLTNPAGAAATARSSDRDWHVIVQHAGLAALYEKFLLNDLQVAAAHQALTASLPPAPAALEELAAAALTVPTRTPTQYFAPKTITANMKIQPLLTPDNYKDFILPLIESAQQSLYMQTQYIHPSDRADDTKLQALIQALAQKIHAGLDVKLIMSQYETQDWLEKVQDANIPLSCVRLQHGVHNKGIVVDGKIVVVSSQNWSGDGVARNRDAGLIIDNEVAAQYWQAIFQHDWDHMAMQTAAD